MWLSWDASPEHRRFSDLARHPDNEPVPGALLVRVESSLLYFNAEHVRDVGRGPASCRGHAAKNW